MREIRSDLQERVGLMEERIKAAHAQCEEKIKQLQNERDARVAELKESIAMLAKLVEFEQREIGNVPPDLPQHSLADFIERKLIELGPLSRDDLCNLAVKEGLSATSKAPLKLWSPHCSPSVAKNAFVLCRMAPSRYPCSHQQRDLNRWFKH